MQIHFKENPIAAGLSAVGIVLLLITLIMGIMGIIDYTYNASEPPQWFRWAFWAGLIVGGSFNATAAFMRRPRR